MKNVYGNKMQNIASRFYFVLHIFLVGPTGSEVTYDWATEELDK